MYISLCCVNEWSVKFYPDNSYTLYWGQTGIHATVPAASSPFKFAVVYAWVRQIPLESERDDVYPLDIEMQSEVGGERHCFLGNTYSLETIRNILLIAQAGARPFWDYGEPTLDDLAQRFPLNEP